MKVDVMFRRERGRNQTPDCAFPQVTGSQMRQLYIISLYLFTLQG